MSTVLLQSKHPGATSNSFVHHAKVTVYLAQIKSKHVTSDKEVWYEQSIDLLLECKRCFYLLESGAQHGYCAVNENGYKEIDFEMMELASNWLTTELHGNLNALVDTPNTAQCDKEMEVDDCSDEIARREENESIKLKMVKWTSGLNKAKQLLENYHKKCFQLNNALEAANTLFDSKNRQILVL